MILFEMIGDRTCLSAGKNYKTKKRRCVKMRTFFFYAQSPDFHKQGLCYYLKILYL